MSATVAPTVEIDLPLPLRSLGKGASVHWRTVRSDYADAKFAAWAMTCELINVTSVVVKHPWPHARMDIEWLFAGIQPDDDNVVTRCAAYRDGVAAAGLVTDDRHITIGAITFQRVTRAEQRVVLTFTRIGDEPT